MKCAFCGAYTEAYKAVTQIPEFVCPQNFLTELVGINGDCLGSEDIVCIAHEEDFNLKYKSQQRNLPYEKKHLNYQCDTSEQSEDICAKCGDKNATRFIRI